MVQIIKISLNYITSHTFATIMMFCLFSLVSYGFYLLVNEVLGNSKKQSLWRDYLVYARKEMKKERAKTNQTIKQDGFLEDRSFFAKMDRVLSYGVKKKYEHLFNHQLFFAFSLFTGGVLALLIHFFIKNVLISITVFGSFPILLYMAFLFIYTIRLKQVEMDITTFINLMESYAPGSNDIVSLLGKVYPHLDDPLQSMVEDCYNDGRTTGDSIGALERFSEKINHRYIRFILRNLAICSKFEANYKEVITDSKKMLQQYLQGKEKRKAMVRNAAITVALLFVGGYFMINLLNNSFDASITEVLLHDLIGNIILVYCCIVLIGSVIFLVVENNKA